MTRKKTFTVEDAYAIETPEDSIRLYGDWAESYDSDFVSSSGYVLYRRVADVFLSGVPELHGPVLDIGCGTGLVGGVLREAGIEIVDGIDISKPMLDEAGKKRTGAGDAVYRNLIAADLTQTLDIPSDQYAALVSAGTFTLGHVGPDALGELWRVAAPGAHCAIGVRTTHYEKAGFAAVLAANVDDGLIAPPDLVEIPIYSDDVGNPERANDSVYVVVCKVTN